MRIYYCDGCGKEHDSSDIKQVLIPVHITRPEEAGYVVKDRYGYSHDISGSEDAFDVCRGCQNKIHKMVYDFLIPDNKQADENL